MDLRATLTSELARRQRLNSRFSLRAFARALGTHHRLAILPATSHTAVITQPDLLHAFIEPFLRGETPKGIFQ